MCHVISYLKNRWHRTFSRRTLQDVLFEYKNKVVYYSALKKLNIGIPLSGTFSLRASIVAWIVVLVPRSCQGLDEGSGVWLFRTSEFTGVGTSFSYDYAFFLVCVIHLKKMKFLIIRTIQHNLNWRVSIPRQKVVIFQYGIF